MITNETRKQKIQTLSDEVFNIYTSAELTLAIKQSLLTHQITKKDEFIDLVGDTLIELLPRPSFEELLVSAVGASPDSARTISQNFRPFFDKAEGSVHADALEAKERLELRPQASAGAAPVVGKPADPSTAKPLTREELMSALAGKRTMAQDIEALRQKREAIKSGGASTPSMPPPPPTTVPQQPIPPVPPSH